MEFFFRADRKISIRYSRIRTERFLLVKAGSPCAAIWGRRGELISEPVSDAAGVTVTVVINNNNYC